METKFNGNSLKSGIYQIRNINNEKVYIGSAKNFKSRYYNHLASLRKGTHHNKHLQGAFNLEGTDAFIFEVLEVVEGEQADRLLIEQNRLDMFADSWEECYNFDKKSVASSRSCFSKNPEKTRKLISENSKRLWSNPEFKEKSLKRMKAGASTPEAKEREKIGKIESWKSEDRRRKNSEVHKARWGKMTKEERIKFSKEKGLSRKEVVEKRSKTSKKNIDVSRQIIHEQRYSKIVETVNLWSAPDLNSRAKLFERANLISPSGILYVNIQNLNAFAKEFGMTHKESWKLQQVIEGARWQHKGWIRKMYTI